VFQLGVGWFAAASLLCGLAPNIELLIGARVLQGIGGALLTPGAPGRRACWRWRSCPWRRGSVRAT
jgi:MFS family permease